MQTIITKNWDGRFPTRAINVGNVGLGGKYPIRLQSMTSTPTLDTIATVEQSLRIIEAGADFVRISVPNIKSAENLAEIKKKITEAGYKTPLIADIHFNPKIALVAARIADKIRINPGNYSTLASFNKKNFNENDYNKEIEEIHKKINPLLLVCREYGTAIRIGTNHGSLSQRILHQYGNTAEGMTQATLEYLRIFEDHGFYNTVISLKASNPLIMIDAYRQMAEALLKRKITYPMHIGVTEAGAGDDGRIRSALGICSLLNDGIGDTIRVSLSENPENEIPFAKKITQSFEKHFLVKNDKEKTDFDETEKFAVINEIRNKIPKKPFDKPVVISSCYKEHNLSQEEFENQAQNTLKPDFVYCAEHTKKHESNLIIPLSSWKENKNPNTFPLLKLNEVQDAKNIKTTPVFLYAEPSEISIKEIKAVSAVKGAVLILSVHSATNIRNIIEHINNIYRYKPVPVIINYTSKYDDREKTIVEIAGIIGYMATERILNGLWINTHNAKENNITTMLSYSLLQAAGLRITSNQYISCPTCARTSYNLQEVLEEVKKHTQHIKGLKIAVMGCVVNGPGEMADADYGLVGAASGKIHIYKKQQIIIKNIDQKNAAPELVKQIEKFENI